MSEQNYSKAVVKAGAKFTDPLVFEKEKSYALQIFKKNPYLQKATFDSVLSAMANVANVGLTLNPALKLAYLVPRYNGQTRMLEVCLEPSYQGLVKLVTDTGSAKSLYAYLIREGDDFTHKLGTSVEIDHKPKFPASDKIIGVYAVAILADGTKQVEIMELKEIESIRERSESYKSYKAGKSKQCIWITDEGEMFRKTIIRRITKYLPKTEMWDKIAKAIELDEQDYKISDGQADYIDSLLLNSSLDHDERERIEKGKWQLSGGQAADTISMLKDNQLDPILSGNNYTQTDIKKHLNKQ